MKNLLILFFLLLTSASNSKELICYFEEVYRDGEVQQGVFLYKNKSLRYEYFKKNLYTIFKKKDDFFIQRNDNREVVQKINDNANLINKISDLIENYPSKIKVYQVDNYLLNLYASKKFNFYNRIGVKSVDLNLNIYFNDCLEKKIHQKYFSFNPFFSYELISN